MQPLARYIKWEQSKTLKMAARVLFDVQWFSGVPVLREEIEEAVLSLKAGKSPGVDNISSEMLSIGG